FQPRLRRGDESLLGMSALAEQRPRFDAAPLAGSPAVEIVVPVYNEREQLEASIRRLHAYLTSDFPFSFELTIADNASTDDTWAIAQRLSGELPNVRALRLDEQGRGRALHAVWSRSEAP